MNQRGRNDPSGREHAEPDEAQGEIPPWLWTLSALLTLSMAWYIVKFGGSFSVAAHEVEEPGLAWAQRSTVLVRGDAVFASVCAACHQRHGRGIPGAYPPLAGSPWLLREKETPIRIVLHGLAGPIEVNRTRFDNRMPPLGEKLSDEEIAAALSHARAMWGNAAPRISALEVHRVREGTPPRGAWTPTELERARPPAGREGPS
jgi:mono/diheme cytochrome c family protein